MWSKQKFYFFCCLYYVIILVAVIGTYLLSKYWLSKDWLIQILVVTLIGSMLGIDGYFFLFDYEKYKVDYKKSYGIEMDREEPKER